MVALTTMGKMTTISTRVSHDKGGDGGEDEDDYCAMRGVSLFSASTMTTKGAIARDSTLSLCLSALRRISLCIDDDDDRERFLMSQSS